MTMPPLLPPAVPLGRRVDAMSIYGNNPYSPRVYSLQVEELRQALNEANADRELLTRDNATLERQIETHQTLAASRHNTGNRPYPSSNRRSPSPSPRTGSTAAVELASLKASLQDVTAALNETSASLEEERQGHEARLERLEVEALNRACVARATGLLAYHCVSCEVKTVVGCVVRWRGRLMDAQVAAAQGERDLACGRAEKAMETARGELRGEREGLSLERERWSKGKEEREIAIPEGRGDDTTSAKEPTQPVSVHQPQAPTTPAPARKEEEEEEENEPGSRIQGPSQEAVEASQRRAEAEERVAAALEQQPAAGSFTSGVPELPLRRKGQQEGSESGSVASSTSSKVADKKAARKARMKAAMDAKQKAKAEAKAAAS